MTVESTTAAPIAAPAVQPPSIPQTPAPAAAPAPAQAPVAAPVVAASAPVVAAPAAIAAPAVAPPVATSPAPAATPASEPADPNWLPDRLRRAEQAAVAKAMTDLGVTDLGAAKAAIAQAKALEEANKSEIQRISERAAKAEARAARVDTLEAIVADRLVYETKALTPEQQEAVTKIAGDDPAVRLRTIDALRATWAVAAPPATTVAPASAVAALATVAQPAAPPAAPPPQAPLAAPVQTAPTTHAPAGASVPASDHLAEYERLAKDHKTARQAATHLSKHQGEILAAMDARRRASA